MTQRALVLTVARWEFLRFIKLRQQVISFAVNLAIGLLGGGIGMAVSKAQAKPVEVAVIGAGAFGSALPDVRRVTWKPSAENEPALRQKLSTKSLDGYVVIVSPDSVRVVLRDKATWPDRVREALSSSRSARLLAASGITPAQLSALQSELGVSTEYTVRKRDSGKGDKLTVFGILLLVFVGMISGVSYLFTGITGEKQQRVTESVLSAISPQTWLDGKILGLIGVALVGVVNSLCSIIALGTAAVLTFGDRIGPISVPSPQPMLVVQVLVIVVLGITLMYAAIGAFTSTIDDPNNSMRSTAILLPMLPISLAWMVQDKADSVLVTMLSLFPFTSFAVLPVRLAITTPPWWEFPVATALMLTAIWLTRRLGGKLFAASVQMYGKEPSWREMFGAIRAG